MNRIRRPSTLARDMNLALFWLSLGAGLVLWLGSGPL